MTDRELLDRIRAVVTELELLIEAADSNTKYHTRSVLEVAWIGAVRAESALVWHVEG